MTTRTLSGQLYHAHSPSLYEQAGHPVMLGFDGHAWLIAVRDVWGTREFRTVNEAADLAAQAFTTAAQGEAL